MPVKACNILPNNEKSGVKKRRLHGLWRQTAARRRQVDRPQRRLTTGYDLKVIVYPK